MSLPTHIMYQGRTYRLAADAAEPVAPDTILETAGNPTAKTSAPAAPDAGEGDRKTLELLNTNVTTKAKALAEGMGAFMAALSDRANADQVLQAAKDNLDGLLEDFKLLSGKYSGYAKRHLSE